MKAARSPEGRAAETAAKRVAPSVPQRAGNDGGDTLFGVSVGENGVSFCATQPEAPTARSLAAEGMSRAAMADRGWLPIAAEVIEELAAAGEEFSAENVRARAGSPVSPALVGAAFKIARLRGVIEPAGLATAQRAVSHGRLLRTWRGRGLPA